MTPTETSQRRLTLQNLTGYTINDDDLITEVIWKAGPTVIGGRVVPKGNERLAMVGDAAMYLAGLAEWYDANDTKGAMNTKLSAMACNANLVRVMRPTSLPGLIVLNGGTTQVSDDTLATTVEAVIGAIYLDSGRNIASVRDALIKMGLLSKS